MTYLFYRPHSSHIYKSPGVPSVNDRFFPVLRFRQNVDRGFRDTGALSPLPEKKHAGCPRFPFRCDVRKLRHNEHSESAKLSLENTGKYRLVPTAAPARS